MLPRRTHLPLMGANFLTAIENRQSYTPPISPGSSTSSSGTDSFGPRHEYCPSYNRQTPVATISQADSAMPGSYMTNLSEGYNFVQPTQLSTAMPADNCYPSTSLSDPFNMTYPNLALPPSPPSEESFPAADLIGSLDELKEILSGSEVSSHHSNDLSDLEFELFLGTENIPSIPPQAAHAPVLPKQAQLPSYNECQFGQNSIHELLQFGSSNTDITAFSAPSPPAEMKRSTKKPDPTISLPEFLMEMLYYQCYEHIISWKNREEGNFKISDSQSLAKLWGFYKNHPDMNFDKMSRAMRYYYDKGVLEKGQGARLEYKFGQRSNFLKFQPPVGSEPMRFFKPRAPRRRSRAAKNVSTQPCYHHCMQVQPLTQTYPAAPSNYGPQRSFQTYAGTRQTYPY